jgi:hypothetical protein
MTADHNGEVEEAHTRPPTSTASKLVRYILGFGVGIGVGLAPYLGVYEVPFFYPLLTLIPKVLREPVLPISAAVMGILAVSVQWYEGETITRTKLRRLFKRTLITAILSLSLLLVVHQFVVVRIATFDNKYFTALVGFSRPVQYPCVESNLSDEECIGRLSLSQEKINTFWGPKSVKLAGLLLTGLYLVFTGAFGTMIGLIILRDTIDRVERPKTSSKKESVAIQSPS